jgi:ferredoxin
VKARIVDRNDVFKIVDQLRQQGFQVMAPFRGRERDSYYDLVTDENRNRIALHCPNPYYPPKRFTFPHIERTMQATRKGDTWDAQATYDIPKLAVFGVRSCDIAGLFHLDRFFLGKEFRDIYYEKHRENLFLVNVACTDTELDISKSCFCVCTDTGPAAKDHFDLQIMDLGSECMVVAGTPAGEAFFKDPMFRKGTQAHVDKRHALLNNARASFKERTSWFSAIVRHISQGKVLEKTWQQVGTRCVECGGCTYVCPACTCFTVSDRPVSADTVDRFRMWDACSFAGFTRMAGGHNPRKAVHDRRNRRFFRKLSHYFIQRELQMACVGCGRCAEVCHGDIGMPSVVEIIRRATSEAA